ncbi:stage II sporulation protein P [Anaerospora hongkongensis]|uniref:stage II sporulation protein P n=1 Tax=Anaerospora hongkongensis TaxID=244830 RepID=UPI0028988D04|nr:stage II sporulation protein P [Anaerospora hongkongensis]
MKSSIKHKFGLLLGGIVVGMILILGLWYFAPQYLPGPFKKSEQMPAKPPYAYYVIQDEATGKILMYVAVVTVSVGDELLMDDGKWYRVVRVEENIAYAKQFEKQMDE